MGMVVVSGGGSTGTSISNSETSAATESTVFVNGKTCTSSSNVVNGEIVTSQGDSDIHICDDGSRVSLKELEAQGYKVLSSSSHQQKIRTKTSSKTSGTSSGTTGG